MAVPATPPDSGGSEPSTTGPARTGSGETQADHAVTPADGPSVGE
jgi:hypothetical protein